MDDQKFKVIYTGKLKDGFDVNTVAAQFAIKFKQTPEKALKILQANKEVTLIKQAEHKKAYTIKTALESLGLNVRLQRAAIVAPSKPAVKTESQPVKSDEESKQATGTPDTPAEGLTLEPVQKESQEPEVNAKHETSNYAENPSVHLQSQESTVTEISGGGTLGDMIKKMGALIVGGLAVLFVILKKLGLLKLLKIGGVVAAAAFAGYNPEEMCMGNQRCEDAVDEQFDICWDTNNMDDYDWDNMSEATYYALQPKIEREFVGCFIYEDTNERVFHSPLDLRIDLIDNCDVVSKKGCIEQVEPQINSCYENHNIGDIVSADTLDFYQAVENNQKRYKSYLGCFLDDSGNKMFQLILDNWAYYYLEDNYY